MQIFRKCTTNVLYSEMMRLCTSAQKEMQIKKQHYSRRWVKEDLAVMYVKECILPIFSSKSFIASGLPFKSLIHFEFIFVYGVRKCSSFILLLVAVQFSQHHLLKRLSFLHCIFLPLLPKKVAIARSSLTHLLE